MKAVPIQGQGWFLLVALGVVLLTHWVCSTPTTWAANHSSKALPQSAEPINRYVSGIVLGKSHLQQAQLHLSHQKPHTSAGVSWQHPATERVQIQITSGPDKGKVVIIENSLTGHPGYDIVIHPGDRVLLNQSSVSDKVPEQLTTNLADHNRWPVLLTLLGLSGTALLLYFACRGQASAALRFLALGVIVYWLWQALLFPFLNPTTASPTGIAEWLWLLSVCLLSPIGLLILFPTANTSEEHTTHKRFHLYQATVLGCFINIGLLYAVIQLAPLSGYLNETLAGLWPSYPHLKTRLLLCMMQLAISLPLTYWTLNIQLIDRKSPILLMTMTVLAGMLSVNTLPLWLIQSQSPFEQWINLEQTSWIIGSACSCLLGLLGSHWFLEQKQK